MQVPHAGTRTTSTCNGNTGWSPYVFMYSASTHMCWELLLVPWLCTKSIESSKADWGLKLVRGHGMAVLGLWLLTSASIVRVF